MPSLKAYLIGSAAEEVFLHDWNSLFTKHVKHPFNG